MKVAVQEIGTEAGSIFSKKVVVATLVSVSMLLAVGSYLSLLLDRRAEEDVFTRLELAAAGLRATLVERISNETHLSESFAALIEANETFVETEFERLAAILLRDRPEVINVAIAPDMIINHVYPVEPNQSVIGLDLFEVFGGDVVRSALQKNRTLIEGPVATVQGPTAIITRTPVQMNSADPPEFWGMVSVVVNSDAILEHASELARSGYFDIVISQPGREEPIFGSARPSDDGVPSFDFSIEGLDWRVEIFPTNRLLSEVSWENLLVKIAFSALIIPLVGLLIFYAAHNRIVGRLKTLLFDSINGIDDGFVVYDAQDRFIFCNDAYKKIYQKSADLFVPGMLFSDIIREGVRRGQYADAIGCEEEFIARRLEAHEHATSTTVQKLPDGTFLKISERKLSDGSRVGFRVDITELEEARAAAEQAFQAKSEFVSVLSHELRTPLTVIMGYAKVMTNVGLLKTANRLEASLAEDDPNIEDIVQSKDQFIQQISMYATKIESSGAHLLTLINDLLDYSKIEQGRFQLHPEKFSLKTVVSSIVEDMCDLASEKGIQLIDGSEDVELVADKIRFKQVMINLIGNAIKFTDSGSITLGTSVSKTEVEITVSDTGCGIPVEKMNKIFEAFQQADVSDRRSAGGTGLGLAISQTITEMHGGTLSVTSEIGQGSTFTVRMPLGTEEPSGAPKPRKRLSRSFIHA